MVALEISLQKGCFGCLPLLLFFCMFECFQEDLGWFGLGFFYFLNFGGCLVFFLFKLG